MTSVPAIVFAQGVEEYIIAKTFSSVFQRPYPRCELMIIEHKPRDQAMRDRSVKICRDFNN